MTEGGRVGVKGGLCREEFGGSSYHQLRTWGQKEARRGERREGRRGAREEI